MGVIGVENTPINNKNVGRTFFLFHVHEHIFSADP